MENLNAEQIIKALECCTRGRKSNEDIPCLECPYNECNIVGGTSERQVTGTCQGWLMKDALALIKSQEQRIEAYRQELAEVRVALAEANNDKKKLTEENAKLARSCTELEQKCASVKADTVRKMKERIKEKCKNLFSGLDVCIIVDQIANELLEESDET